VADMTVHVDPEDDLSDDESVGELPDRQTITSALADIDVNPTRLHIHYLTQRVSLELIYDSPPANLNELKTALEEWSKKQPWLANSTIVVVG
jgi:hypothetical protein